VNSVAVTNGYIVETGVRVSRKPASTILHSYAPESRHDVVKASWNMVLIPTSSGAGCLFNEGLTEPAESDEALICREEP
jgi:hypothetical protein